MKEMKWECNALKDQWGNEWPTKRKKNWNIIDAYFCQNYSGATVFCTTRAWRCAIRRTLRHWKSGRFQTFRWFVRLHEVAVYVFWYVEQKYFANGQLENEVFLKDVKEAK
jgi:hypothetical protein